LVFGGETLDLRHTCGAALISGWWGRGWSLIEVRDQLGHKDIKTTQRYAHLAPDVLMAAARATTGPTPNMPAACPRPTPRLVQVSGIIQRATEDSNLWPSAPEADALSS
jgi:Phage integrase family